MAYEIKYRVTIITQAGVTMRLDMFEDAYSGAIIEYPATNFQLQYIPSSDDPFEAIYASQLAVGIDVTDDVSNMPDFTTLNDRKYLCKLYAAGVLEWQGGALSDNVQFLFSTGRKELVFNAVCGLGLLKDIAFTSVISTNTRMQLMNIITICLGLVGFPTNLNILDTCSIYAVGMSDRDVDPSSSPFFWAYTQLQSLLNSENEYDNCLQILDDIMISFGCRIFQAKGEWNIIQMNQACLATPWFTRSDGAGTILNWGTLTNVKNIPTDMIFIGGSQVKIFKKGYNNIKSVNTVQYPSNFIFNSDLKLNDATNATGWAKTADAGGTATLVNNPITKNNTWVLTLANSLSFAQIEITSLPTVEAGTQIKLNWLFINGSFANVSGHACQMILTVNFSSTTYYLDTDGDWQLVSGPITNPFGVPAAEINLFETNGYSLTTKVLPLGGSLTFALRLNGDTGNSMTISDFKMTIIPTFKGLTVTSKISDTKQYQKEISFPFGAIPSTDGSYNFKGYLSNSVGFNYSGWYMMDKKNVESFRSLIELMVKNYVVMYRRNIINVDANLEGINSWSALERMLFTDSDPSQISITDKYYMIGSQSVNYAVNELQGTLLQLENTNVTATIDVIYDIDKNVTVTTTARRLGNNATLNKPAACALSYGSQLIYFASLSRVAGDIAYANSGLTTRFNGASLWWKVEIVESAGSDGMRISSVGVLMDVLPC